MVIEEIKGETQRFSAWHTSIARVLAIAWLVEPRTFAAHTLRLQGGMRPQALSNLPRLFPSRIMFLVSYIYVIYLERKYTLTHFSFFIFQHFNYRLTLDITLDWRFYLWIQYLIQLLCSFFHLRFISLIYAFRLILLVFSYCFN